MQKMIAAQDEFKLLIILKIYATNKTNIYAINQTKKKHWPLPESC